MIGSQLWSSQAIDFMYLTDTNNASVGPGAAGSVPIIHRHTKIAENNSAFPADRISYQYHLFKDGARVTGLAEQTGPTGLPSPLPPQRVLPWNADHDVGVHTFAWEKSFADGLFSVEVRLPFAYGLSSRLDMNCGQVTGDLVQKLTPDSAIYYLQVDPTVRDTWGREGWELQDISLVLKAAIYRDPTNDFCFSGGFQVVAPTARGTRVSVTDYWAYYLPPYGAFWSMMGRRTRTFDVGNDTWTLSPFLALSSKPTPLTFFNAFVQLDVPVGTDKIAFAQHYETTYLMGPFSSLIPTHYPQYQPVQETFTGSVRDQLLAQLDLGGGYWLYQNPQARWIKGVAAVLGIHVLQTLEDADSVQLPRSNLYQLTATGVSEEVRPTVGNSAGSMTLTDLSFGIDTRLGKASDLAVGGTVPLGTGRNRTFSSELAVRLNLGF